jgi:hypothetical protein
MYGHLKKKHLMTGKEKTSKFKLGVIGEGSPGKAVIDVTIVKYTSLFIDPKYSTSCPIRRRDSEIEDVLKY